jgi:beta-glucosidase
MKRSIPNFLAVSVLLMLLARCASKDDYKNTSLPIERRIESIISQMTLDEKLAMLQIESDTVRMNGFSFGLLGFLNNSADPKLAAEQYNSIQKYLKTQTRFGIPGLKNGEGIFAYMGYQSTSFPQPLAQAASWDTQIVARVADIVGEEMKSRGVRAPFSPVLNIARDSRWGRTGETYGEDPYLVTQMGVAYCKTLSDKKMLACVKHFAGNTGHNGKFGDPVFYSARYYREYEFAPYEAAIKKGFAKTVMMAYNTSDAIPCAQNEWMMNKVIKGEWNFDGIIYSDGGGLDLIHQSFGIDSSKTMVVAKAINAGCDFGLDDRIYYGESLKKAVLEGLVSERTVNESVRRVLRQIFSTGLYDNPYVDPAYAEKINDCDAHRHASLEVAGKCMVLLKNENHTLPFNKNIKNVLVTGPLAKRLLVNHYGGWGRKEVTVLEGVKNTLPGANVLYEPGAGLRFTFYPAIDKKYFYTREDGRLKKGLKAEYFNNPDWKGEPKLITTDPNIDYDYRGNAPIGFENGKFSVRWTGKFIAPFTGNFKFTSNADWSLSVYINDKIVVDMTKGTTNAIFSMKGEIFLEKNVEYNIRAEYSGNVYAKLGWNADEFELIPRAIEAAEKADAIIAVVGMYDDENGDRACLDLDDVQEKLILELAALNKPMVVVIQTGTVITAYKWADKVPSILMAWYPGEEGGNAIARTLFGENNPGGKLPITFPKVTGQLPLTYNLLPGKPTDFYWDYGNEPLFCFGHGLSYSSFEYSKLKISDKKIKPSQTLTISLDVKNTSNVPGDEVVQLYIHDVLGSVSRPLKELKGFERITLGAGVSKYISFTITAKDLTMWDINMKKIVEPGEFEIMVGASSSDIRLRTKFEVIQ